VKIATASCSSRGLAEGSRRMDVALSIDTESGTQKAKLVALAKCLFHRVAEARFNPALRSPFQFACGGWCQPCLEAVTLARSRGVGHAIRQRICQSNPVHVGLTVPFTNPVSLTLDQMVGQPPPGWYEGSNPSGSTI
jgi:hypothetical protein